MNLIWMISKTKKRLYSETVFTPVVVLGFLSLCFTIFVCLKGSIDQPTRGWVEMRMPVAYVSKNDKRLSTHVNTVESALTKKSPTVILTESGDLFFGTIGSFTDEFNRKANKYWIKQQDGVPQAGALLESLRNYKKSLGFDSEHIVLLPASSVPMNIVIQFSQMIQDSGDFKHVILAHGLL